MRNQQARNRSTGSTQRRKRGQFSLASLFVLVSALALLFAWVRHNLVIREVEARAIGHLMQIDGQVVLEPHAPAIVRGVMQFDFLQRAKILKFNDLESYVGYLPMPVEEHPFQIPYPPPHEPLIPATFPPETFNTQIAHVSALRQLTELVLYRCSVDDRGLASVEHLANLDKLDLTGTRVTDDGLKHLQGLRYLKELVLAGTSISDEGLAHLCPLANLETLNLSSTSVTDAGFAHLRRLQRLKDLSLDGTPVSDKGLQNLGNLAHLRALSLRDTDVSDAGLRALRGAADLRHLYLSGPQFTNAALARLEGLEHLETLDANGTRITPRAMLGFHRARPEIEIDLAAPVVFENRDRKAVCTVGDARIIIDESPFWLARDEFSPISRVDCGVAARGVLSWVYQNRETNVYYRGKSFVLANFGFTLRYKDATVELEPGMLVVLDEL